MLAAIAIAIVAILGYRLSGEQVAVEQGQWHRPGAIRAQDPSNYCYQILLRLTKSRSLSLSLRPTSKSCPKHTYGAGREGGRGP